MAGWKPSLALIVLVLAVLGPGRGAAHADPSVPPQPGFDAAQCLQRLRVARQELLDRGFRPTTDGDTARWLQVSTDEDGQLAMSLVMRTSADGAQTGYYLSISRGKRAGASGWRLTTRPLCCDDNHEKSDHIVEHKWARRGLGQEAEVALHRFAEALGDPAQRRLAELFTDVGRRAADDCLRARTSRGSSNRPR